MTVDEGHVDNADSGEARADGAVAGKVVAGNASAGNATTGDKPWWRRARPRSIRWWTNVLAGEFWLERWPNGGTAIFVRTLWITTLMYGIALTLRAIGYTDWSGFNLHRLCTEVAETVTWLGAIAAGVYTALYTRFSSQWTYLSGVYHQIKGAILMGPSDPSPEQKTQLTYWKAAFVEDAQDLHLARKKMFAMTVWVWLGEPEVADKFDRFTTGGRRRRIRLERDLRADLLGWDPTLPLRKVESLDATPPPRN